MRFLFVTIQSFESAFYGAVGDAVARAGEDVAHVTYSRRAAQRLAADGRAAESLLDRIRELPAEAEPAQLADALATRYALPSIRDAYRGDPVCERKSEEACVGRTTAHFHALERLFDELQPDVLVSEAGSETIRTAAHLVALERGVPTLFVLHTIFPNSLRLAVDRVQGAIVPPEALRALSPAEREEVERFSADYRARTTPLRGYRELRVTGARLRGAVEYTVARLTDDRDNDHARPARWALDYVRSWGRSVGGKTFYRELGARPFVYFPLHDTHDYKIKRLVPHLADQVSLGEQLADALPPGLDLVVKEHPLAIGKSRLSELRRLRARPNVRLVRPRMSTHALLASCSAVVVVSSTVGLEALLYEKPVLTLGRPYYAGYGVTMDIDSTAEIRDALPALPSFRPDPERIRRFLHAAMRACYPGAPVLVDRSPHNAALVAASLREAAASLAAPLRPAARSS